MSILILEEKNYSNKALKLFKQIGKIYFFKNKKFNKNKIKYLVVRLNYNINEKFINKFPNLKIIISPTTGLNHIDTEFCKKKKIKILSFYKKTSMLSKISSTAELNFGLILSLTRNIVAYHNATLKTKKFNRYLFKTFQLKSMTLGIIGMGRIGKKINQYAKAFGIKILHYDIKKKSSKTSLNYLLKNSDILTINTNSDELIITKRNYQKLKNGSYIINTSRGEQVDEKIIYKLLKTKKINGYACDVLNYNFEKYGIIKSMIYKAASEGLNVIITPHIGGSTVDAMKYAEEKMANYFIKKAIIR